MFRVFIVPCFPLLCKQTHLSVQCVQDKLQGGNVWCFCSGGSTSLLSHNQPQTPKFLSLQSAAAAPHLLQLNAPAPTSSLLRVFPVQCFVTHIVVLQEQSWS